MTDDAWKERFQPGDRVRIVKEVEQWSIAGLGPLATITGPKQVDFGAGNAHCDDPKRKSHSWGIRLDNYDYNLSASPDNCHTAWDGILEYNAPDDDEMAAMMASIADAASRRAT